MSQQFDCAVIGAGITGLTAAYVLQKKGKNVVLIEPEKAGGLIQSVHKNGFVLENGPNLFLEKLEIRSLVNELGLSNDVMYPAINYQQYVWYNGKICAVPKSPIALIRTPLLTMGDKFKLATNIFRKNVIPPDFQGSIGEMIRLIGGESTASNILDPALRGIFGGDKNELAARSLFPEMADHLRSGGSLVSYMKAKGKKGKKRSFALRGGNQRIATAIEQNLANVHAARVTQLEHLADQGLFRCIYENGEKILAKEIVVATSGPASGKFLGSISPELTSELCSVQYSTIIGAHFSLPRSTQLIPDAFGVLIPSHAQRPTLGIMFNSQLFPEVAPSDRHLVTICLGGLNKDLLLSLSDAQIQQLAESELKEILNISDLDFLSFYKHRSAIPQYGFSHRSLLERIEQTEGEFPGLHLLGSDRGGVGVPDRVARAMLVQ